MLKKLSLGFAASAAAIIGLSAVTATPAQADSVADFYKGKTVRIVAAAGAGGGFGRRTRLLVQYLGKHLPGHPKMIAQFMPGAGGRKAAAWIYGVAPKDGTAFGVLFHNIATVAALTPKKAKYDPSKFNWLGSQSPSFSTIYVWHTAPATTPEGLRKHTVIAGSQSKSSAGYMSMHSAMAIGGYKFKFVFGYRGTADYFKAIEAGEIQAAVSDWDGIVSTRPNWVKEGKVIPVAQFHSRKHPALPNVPRLLDLATNETDRKIAMFYAGSAAMGHTNVAPPGVPKERVAALRKAIAATYRDPAFIKTATKLRMAVDPVSGKQVAAEVKKILNASPAFLAKVKVALGQN